MFLQVMHFNQNIIQFFPPLLGIKGRPDGYFNVRRGQAGQNTTCYHVCCGTLNPVMSAGVLKMLNA